MMNKTFFPQRFLLMLFVSIALFLACSQRVTTQQEASEDRDARRSISKSDKQLSTSDDFTLAPKMDAWLIHVETEGGFSGGGRGAIAVTSQGKVVAITARNINQEYSICRVELSITDLQNINAAVVSAKPAAWRPTYTPPHDVGCCDRFGWKIKLRRRESGNIERAYATSWFDGNPLPVDVTSVIRAAQRIMTDVLKRCRE